MDKLRYLSRGADAVVLAGSLPRGVADGFYADAARGSTAATSGSSSTRTASCPARARGGAVARVAQPARSEQLVGQELNDEEDS
jgi:hypothetical protein